MAKPFDDPKSVGKALRMWTSNSIGRSSKSVQSKQLAAANFLGEIPNQPFTNIAYRAIVIDKNLGSFKALKQVVVDRGYPESFSSNAVGCKGYVENALGWNPSTQGVIILAIKASISDWLFNVNYLTSLLPPAEQKLLDEAGFSLVEYRGQRELVAKAGTLARAFAKGNVYLAGSTAPGGRKLSMLPTLQPINASFMNSGLHTMTTNTFLTRTSTSVTAEASKQDIQSAAGGFQDFVDDISRGFKLWNGRDGWGMKNPSFLWAVNSVAAWCKLELNSGELEGSSPYGTSSVNGSYSASFNLDMLDFAFRLTLPDQIRNELDCASMKNFITACSRGKASLPAAGGYALKKDHHAGVTLRLLDRNTSDRKGQSLTLIIEGGGLDLSGSLYKRHGRG